MVVQSQLLFDTTSTSTVHFRRPLQDTCRGIFFHDRDLNRKPGKYRGNSHHGPDKVPFPLQHRPADPPSDELALADSASATSSTTSTVTTDMQPPTASLLGLPAELLNYIITLIVPAEKSKPDLRTFLLAQRQQASIEPKGTFRAYPTPALAGTCTSLEAIVLPIYYGHNPPIFCSPKLAYDWLSTRRQGRSEAAVRQVWIHLEVTRKISEGPGWKQAALEMHLVNETDALVISETSPFYAGACRECQRRLQSEIQQINDRASRFKFGHERLAALADYFNSRGCVPGFPNGCTIYGKHQRNALIGDKQGFAELLQAISWS